MEGLGVCRYIDRAGQKKGANMAYRSIVAALTLAIVLAAAASSPPR